MNLDASDTGSNRSAVPIDSATLGHPSTRQTDKKKSESSQTTIEPSGSGFKLGITEVWRYRELLYFLTWRDIKLRYRQTLLGALWAIIQPLFTMLLFTLFFGRLIRVPSDNIPYPIFAYAGLLIWTFVANTINNSANSLVGSASLVTKVYFPRMIIPAAPVLAGLLDLVLAFAVFIPLLVYYRVEITWQFLLLPIFVVMTTMLAFGVGMLLAALNVRYRDVRYTLPFLIQLWLFASPVIYPSSIMPAGWKGLFQLNPLTGIIEGFRAALFGLQFDWGTISLSFGICILVIMVSLYSFRRVEDSFADVI